MPETLAPQFGGPQRPTQLETIAPALFQWRPNWASWSTQTGVFYTRTLHTLTWSRNGATAPTVTDDLGNSYTPKSWQPAWGSRVLAFPNPDIGTQRLGGLCTVRRETLVADQGVGRVGAHSGLVRFIPDALTDVGSDEVVLYAIATDDDTDPFFLVLYDVNAAVYRAVYFNGTDYVQSEAPMDTSALGEEHTIRWAQAPNGQLVIFRSVMRGSEDLPPLPGGGGGAFLGEGFVGEGFLSWAFTGSGGAGGGDGVDPAPPDISPPITLVPWASGTVNRVNGAFAGQDGLDGVHLGVVRVPGVMSKDYLNMVWE